MVFKRKQGIKIVNARVNGKLEVFNCGDQGDALNYSDCTVEKLFMCVINPGCKEKIFNEFAADTSHLSNVSEFSANMDKILILGDEGIKLIPKALLTHVPVVSYKDF